jgi:AcrR family transcriptional regulator
VVEAARALFVERGYGATTIEAISERADVPPATVYRLFSSKRGILKALFDVSIAGDHESVPLPERPQIKALLAETEPGAQLAGFVAIAAAVNARIGPLYRILVSAAGSDRDAAALLDELNAERHKGQRQLAAALARGGFLQAGMRERDATDVIHALMSPEVYRLLVLDRRWSPDRYERWLADLLADQLL